MEKTYNSLPKGGEFLFCGISGVPIMITSWQDRIDVVASILGYGAKGRVSLKAENGILTVIKDSVNTIDARAVLLRVLSKLDEYNLTLLLSTTMEAWGDSRVIDCIDNGILSHLSHAYQSDDKVVFAHTISEVVEVVDEVVKLRYQLLSNTCTSVSLMPIADSGGCGFGLSFKLFGDTMLCNNFLAGVILHAPECTLFTNNTHPSYVRLNSATCPHYVCYGGEGALYSVEFLSDGLSFECSHPDNTGNPYLVVASIVLAGIMGIDTGLTIPDEVEDINPASVSKLTRLPMNLQEALNLAESSGFLRRLLGESYANLYYKQKTAECKTFSSIVGESEYAVYYHKLTKKVDG